MKLLCPLRCFSRKSPYQEPYLEFSVPKQLNYRQPRHVMTNQKGQALLYIRFQIPKIQKSPELAHLTNVYDILRQSFRLIQDELNGRIYFTKLEPIQIGKVRAFLKFYPEIEKRIEIICTHGNLKIGYTRSAILFLQDLKDMEFFQKQIESNVTPLFAIKPKQLKGAAFLVNEQNESHVADDFVDEQNEFKEESDYFPQLNLSLSDFSLESSKISFPIIYEDDF